MEDRLYLLSLNSGVVSLSPVRRLTRPVRRLILDLYTSFNYRDVILITKRAAERILTRVTINRFLDTIRRRLDTMVRLEGTIRNRRGHRYLLR